MYWLTVSRDGRYSSTCIGGVLLEVGSQGIGAGA